MKRAELQAIIDRSEASGDTREVFAAFGSVIDHTEAFMALWDAAEYMRSAVNSSSSVVQRRARAAVLDALDALEAVQ